MATSDKAVPLQFQGGLGQSHRFTLNPGDFRFYVPIPGVSPLRLYTLLGSCVSVVLWHPERKIGGMSHGLLPARGTRKPANGLDGRYCDEAVQLFLKELTRTNTRPQQYQVFVIGGGDMFQANSKQLIGDRNVEVTRECLRAAGFNIRSEHVRGEVYRTVDLDLNTGTVVLTMNKQRIQLN
jgi:chemotaxis protein CheD